MTVAIARRVIVGRRIGRRIRGARTRCHLRNVAARHNHLVTGVVEAVARNIAFRKPCGDCQRTVLKRRVRLVDPRIDNRDPDPLSGILLSADRVPRRWRVHELGSFVEVPMPAPHGPHGGHSGKRLQFVQALGRRRHEDRVQHRGD